MRDKADIVHDDHIVHKVTAVLARMTFGAESATSEWMNSLCNSLNVLGRDNIDTAFRLHPLFLCLLQLLVFFRLFSIGRAKPFPILLILNNTATIGPVQFVDGSLVGIDSNVEDVRAVAFSSFPFIAGRMGRKAICPIHLENRLDKGGDFTVSFIVQLVAPAASVVEAA